jgi:exopolysaccharide biosynthesis polyprenyl glycosylphosphotransferase
VALRGGELRATGAASARKFGLPLQRSGSVLPWSPVEPAAVVRIPPVRRRFLFETAVVVSADIVVMVLLLAFTRSWFAVVAMVAAAVTWKYRRLYSRRIALSVLDDLPSLTLGVLVALAPATALAVTRGSATSASVLATGAGMLVGMVLARGLAYSVIRSRRASGRLSYPTLVVGAGTGTAALTERINAHPESGWRLIGSLADHPAAPAGKLPRLGSSKDLDRLIRDRGVTDVVIGYGGMSSAALVDVLRTCDRVNVEIYVVPRLYELHRMKEGDDHIWGLPLVRLRRPVQRLPTWRLKRAFDVTFATLALVLAAPLLLAIAVAVRLELGPGIMFRQTRLGLQGHPFEVLKFRSVRMSPAAAASTWTVTPDQIGPVGRFIRRYSLDELPQLVNVLRGDMTLVGPRPERPEYVAEFCALVPRYVHRHRVPVGMTGLAAVNGLRGDTSIADRADFDNWYIENWSLWLDIKILVRTLNAVLGGTGG